MKTYKIHLIKHGSIPKSYKGRYIGITDPPLCPDSKSIVYEHLNKYKYPVADKVFSSPLKRSIDTANILYPNTKTIAVDGLKEFNFGIFENKTLEELSNNIYYKNWMDSSMQTAPPNGEDNAGFIKRIMNSMESIVNSMFKKNLDSVAIITHGTIISMILYIYALPTIEPFNWNFNHLEGITIMTSTMMWAKDHVFETFQKLPIGVVDENKSEFNLLDVDE